MTTVGDAQQDPTPIALPSTGRTKSSTEDIPRPFDPKEHDPLYGPSGAVRVRDRMPGPSRNHPRSCVRTRIHFRVIGSTDPER